jgi:hypothetical protein
MSTGDRQFIERLADACHHFGTTHGQDVEERIDSIGRVEGSPIAATLGSPLPSRTEPHRRPTLLELTTLQG